MTKKTPSGQNISAFTALLCGRFIFSLHNLTKINPELVTQLLAYELPANQALLRDYRGFPLLVSNGARISLRTILFGLCAALTGKALVITNTPGGPEFALINFVVCDFKGDVDTLKLAQLPTSVEEAHARARQFIRDISTADPAVVDQLMHLSAHATPAVAKAFSADDTRPYRVSIAHLIAGLVNVTLGTATTHLTTDDAGLMDFVSYYPPNHENSPKCVA